ncbi:hypothetical protein WR25_04787 isoform B [Diploscapter pachys]|uniref:Ground-like domain-containing protein n=1 Tax=Diploscapter pachys TaxID=2018661 RepID=A0A2A2LH29_9BILA|nr:hypothetical protein WR25_04787 isoform A [Diploscapter pachys]PAV85451.1 hypothetical protein WR25_04787 isoform B [Diploscapter pachys]
MIRTIAITVLSILGLTYAQTPPAYRFVPCDPVKQQTCQAMFNDQMGINASLGIQSFLQLRQAIEQSFADYAADGLLSTCYAFKEFKGCFPQNPTNQYYACAQDPLGLMIDANKTATGISRREAQGYTKIWNQLDFVCGAGFSCKFILL